MRQFTLFVLAAFFVLLPHRLAAQWSDNPTINTPISIAANNQFGPKSVSDGAGGAIIAWFDVRNGIDYDIYAQRINADGAVQWTADGVAISTATGFQDSPVIVSDGAGGAVIAWNDSRSGTNIDIYAQRINAAGVVQWTANGVAISAVTGDQASPTIVSDGGGGAIITWQDARSVGINNNDIYAQRVNAAGVVQWTANGVAICTAAENQLFPTIASDNAGGAIITWVDGRSGIGSDIYAQRINAAGVVQWTAGAGNGIPISTAAFGQLDPVIVSDGAGGAIITWDDYRSNFSGEIYAQRINAAGAVQWTVDGVAISTDVNGSNTPNIASDGAGGAIITYTHAPPNYDIFAQRINAAGEVLWSMDGVAVSLAANDQTSPTLVSDGAGGAIIAWTDQRNGIGDADIYAQRINAAGAVQWTIDGAAISTAVHAQASPTLVSDGAGGAIFSWEDTHRSTTITDIYAQKITGTGLLGDGSVKIQAVNDVKNDQGGKLSVLWSRSPYDVLGDNSIGGYMVLRGIKPSALPAGARVGAFDQTVDLKAKTVSGTSGKYFLFPGVSALTDTLYWQVLGNISPLQQDGYAYTATSLADSGPQGNSLQYFAVWAYTAAPPYGYWYSNIDSGYSVDNLAPVPPVGLMAAVQPGPQIKLTWNPPTDTDVKSYAVYRSVSAGFTPAPGNAIGTSSSISFIDASPPAAAVLYYRIIATDVHGNASLPSAEASAQVPITQLFSVQEKWNMVSVPLIVSDYAKTALFPTATTSAFAFEHTYFGYSVLENGRGYWMKFSTGQTVSMNGLGRTADTVSVVEGWNMVGSLSMSLPVADIGSIPGGIVTGNFFGYDGSYRSSPTLEPGKGYWVKASQAGQLVMTAPGIVPSTSRIRIEDTGEMPPLPPDEVNSTVPNAYALDQNYPNPFNPTTTIRYAIPAAGQVTLTVFNMLGQEVAVLVNEVQDAGEKTVSFDASNLPSGVYTYTIRAGTFTGMKKMMLVR